MSSLQDIMASDNPRRWWAHMALILGLWLGLRFAVEVLLRRPETGALPAGVELQDVGASAGWNRRGYRLVPVKRCRIQAQVLGQEPYYFDALSALSPSDLSLGWGPLAGSGVLSWLRVSQDARGGRWSFEGTPPVAPDGIASHMTNLSVVPANPLLGYKLRALRAGDRVALEGYLVNAINRDGTQWLNPGTIPAARSVLVWVDKLGVQ